MVTVPKTQSVTPNIEPTYQTTRGATAEAFGAGVGRSTRGVGQAIGQASDVATQIAQENMDREAKQLDNEYAAALSNISFGDGTPENPGFYSLEGQNAVNALPKVQEQLKKVRDEITMKATSDRSKRIFGASADERDVQQMRADGQFVMKARKAADDSASEARMALAVSDAARFYNDPAVLDKKVSIMNGEVVSGAKRHGQTSKEEIAAALELGRSAIAQSAFDAAMAAEDFPSAKAVYDQFSGSITGAAKNKMFEALQEGSVRTQAQALSQRAQELFPDDRKAARKFIQDNASGKTEDAAMSNLRASLNDIELDKDMERQIRRDAEHDADRAYTLKERTRTKEEREAMDRATQMIEDGQSYLSLPESIKRSLSLEQREALKRIDTRNATGEPFITEWDKYAEYTGMNAVQLEGVDLSIARTQLSDEEFRVVRGLVDAARQGRGTGTHLFTAHQIFTSRADSLGLRGQDNLESRGRLLTMYQQELALAQEAQGNAPLNNEQMRGILNTLVDEVTLESSWFGVGPFMDKTGPLYDVEVPEDQKQKIIDAYQSTYSRNPTDAEMARAYVQFLERENR